MKQNWYLINALWALALVICIFLMTHCSEQVANTCASQGKAVSNDPARGCRE